MATGQSRKLLLICRLHFNVYGLGGNFPASFSIWRCCSHRLDFLQGLLPLILPRNPRKLQYFGSQWLSSVPVLRAITYHCPDFVRYVTPTFTQQRKYGNSTEKRPKNSDWSGWIEERFKCDKDTSCNIIRHQVLSLTTASMISAAQLYLHKPASPVNDFIFFNMPSNSHIQPLPTLDNNGQRGSSSSDIHKTY